jgi:hypothetical protein
MRGDREVGKSSMLGTPDRRASRSGVAPDLDSLRWFPDGRPKHPSRIRD